MKVPYFKRFPCLRMPTSDVSVNPEL
jgi:hypothetical protein